MTIAPDPASGHPAGQVATDRERQRCYDAETSTFGGTTFDEIVSWEDLVALFEATVRHPWWLALGVRVPSLRPARSDSSTSSADGTMVRIARRGRTAATLLHELTHHLVITGPHDDPGHGPLFRALELRLAELFGGTALREALGRAWRDHGLTVATWAGPEPRITQPLATSLVDAGPGRIRGAISLPSGRVADRPTR